MLHRTDLLNAIRGEIDERIAALLPLLAEYEQLLAAMQALDAQEPGAVGAPAASATRAPRRARQPGGRAPALGGRRPAAGSGPALGGSGPALGGSGPALGGSGPAAGRGPAAGSRGTAAGSIGRAASGSGRPPRPARKSAGGESRPRAGRGAAREAILAALEHGSHTVGELVTVTAMSAANISGNVRRLLAEGAISKTGREGKAAYVLAGSEAQAA